MTCGDEIGTVNEPGTIIVSPNYPNSYPINRNCRMVITLQPDEVVVLQFIHIDIGTSWLGFCDSTDWIEIFDGLDSNAEEICPHQTCVFSHKLCGQEAPLKSVMATNNSMFIQFHSDGKEPGGSFKLRVVKGK